jgi:hypothetical protein
MGENPPVRRTHGGPSGPSGHKPSKFETGFFVAWDGEGSTEHVDGCAALPNGGCGCPHRYVLLKNSQGAERVAEHGISTVDALSVLTSEARRLGPNATHVCFGVSYDANMILGDLDRASVERLWKGERVRVARRWKVAYRARKTLWVKDYGTGSSLTLWDPFGFYQTSFVNAVSKNLGPRDSRLPLIREGKRRRGSFRMADLPFIRRYTEAEISALVDLMLHLRSAFVGAGLTLRRWDGAGAVAAALLEREGLKAHMAPAPDAVHEAALYAYVGGRIETLLYGYHNATVYHGDIRSAYPFAMLGLPSLRHGHWRHVSGHGLGSEGFSVVKVRWDYTRLGDRWSVLPFAFRSTDSAIFFPRKGVGWAWRPEVEAALRHDDLRRRTEILDAWEFVPADPSERPFAFMRRIWDERKKLKDAKNAAEKPLKLGSNSVYGKLVQHVGGTVKKPPPFHQIEWGGYVTSFTRARLFEAAVRAGDSCITLATDGIYATRPMPWLEYGDGLGAWERKEHEAMLIAQSGVYFLRDARERTDGCDRCGGRVSAAPFGCVRCVSEECGWTNLTEHFRGFDEDTLNPDIVLSAWDRKETTVNAKTTRFVTMGRACRTDAAFARWRRWVEQTRKLDICATGKRLDRIEPARWTRSLSPARRLMPTDPADPFQEVSQPYSLGWAETAGETSADAQEQVSL